MNKILCAFGIFFLAFGMCGCEMVKDITEEQSDLIAEYSAGILLNHEDGYEKRLVKDDKTKPAVVESANTEVKAETPAPTPTPTPVSESDVSSNSSSGSSESGNVGDGAKDVSASEAFGVKNLSVNFKDYLLTTKYPKKDTDYTMSSIQGEQYFIARFTIKNKTSSKLSVDSRRNGIKYYLNLNGTDYEAAISIQKNGGLNMLKTSLGGSKSEEAILSFNVPDSIKSVDSASLTILNEKNESRCVITCK